MPRPLPHAVAASTAGERDAVADHILDAAHRVIVDHGLTAASTRAIAAEAGISVGTLYNYFDDRHMLLAHALLRRAHLESRILSEVPARAGRATVAENLHHVAGLITTVLNELVPLFAAAFSDTQLLDAVRRAFRAGADQAGPLAIHPLKVYLAAERDLGRVSADADCDAAASLVLSLCHDRAFHRFFQGKSPSVPSIAREIDLVAQAVTSNQAGATSDTGQDQTKEN